jgi:hypothetical protein
MGFDVFELYNTEGDKWNKLLSYSTRDGSY